MPFVLSLDVRPEDIDDLDHVSNVVYVKWVIDAALAHSAAVGFSQAAYLARKQVWVLRRHEIEYLRSAGPGERLEVETRVISVGAAGSTRKTRILRGSQVLARSTTDWAYVDMARGRVIRIPDDVRAAYPIEPEA
jgi:acyl-CoA thioester hydrolase